MEINRLSGKELAEFLKSGDLSVRQVVESHIQRIEEVNPKLNAVVVPLFEQACNEAKRLDSAHARRDQLGPLHGIPITVKESIEIAGTPSTLGLTDRISHRATADAFQVTRLKQAGAVILGKTNVSLLLKAYETNNPVYGRTSNPWNLDRAPGGSSGGEAAIVAAGGSVLGLGSDLGGSIRLPAHACGLSALRPTSGRLTMSGHARVSSAQSVMMSQPAPISRAVSDLALAMRVLAAPGQELFDANVPPVPLGDPAQVKELRVAYYTDNGIMKPAPAIRRAVLEAAAALAANGADVEEWHPPDLYEAWEIQLRLTCADGLAGYRRALRTSKGAIVRLAAMPAVVRSAMSLLAEVIGQKKLAASMRFKHRVSIDEYFQLLGRRRQYSARFLEAINERGFDVILCPPDALPALKHGSSYYISGSDISYAGLYTLLGMPAGVVAATRIRPNEESDRPDARDVVERAARHVEEASAGLPVGVQVVARHWREDVVLATMGVLESYFRSRPEFPDLSDIPLFS
ncbi:MAG: amidase family protein [Terriglobales bacterium]